MSITKEQIAQHASAIPSATTAVYRTICAARLDISHYGVVSDETEATAVVTIGRLRDALDALERDLGLVAHIEAALGLSLVE